MCKLLLLYNTTYNKKKIHSFLMQSLATTPFIPDVKYPHRHQHRKLNDDGFGFSYFNEHHQWISYKYPGVFLSDPNIRPKIQEISTHSLILGQLRRQAIGDIGYENTAPFTYQNHVFFHNGIILHYKKHLPKIYNRIHPKYRTYIQGQTDSEHIFYLLLTFIDEITKNDNIEDAVMTQCVTALLEWFISEHMYFHINILYANRTHLIVTRYSHLHKNTNKELKEPKPLYIDNTKGLCISSEPITENYMLLPENTILCIPISV
jgi:predicted glutamine amidotransferase